tara:strand:+ start:382 stop:528 length:147 start_codon:yes stop_codon:yes gene_type:complete
VKSARALARLFLLISSLTTFHFAYALDPMRAYQNLAPLGCGQAHAKSA